MSRHRCLPPLLIALLLTGTTHPAFSQSVSLNHLNNASGVAANNTPRLTGLDANLHQFVADSWNHVRSITTLGLFNHSATALETPKKPKYFNSLTDWKIWNSRARSPIAAVRIQSVGLSGDTEEGRLDARSVSTHTTDLQLTWDDKEDHASDTHHGLVMHNGRVSVMAGFGFSDGDKARATIKSTCTAESATYCESTELNTPLLAQNIDAGFNNQHWYQSVSVGIGYRFR